MKPIDLAKLLIESTPEARNSLILEHEPFDAVEIAESLQMTCYEVWTDDPKAVYAIADTLKLIASHTQNPEVQAYSEWVNAIKGLVDGELENCVDYIESSEAIFASLGKMHLAAKTQTSKLYALALLGRYDEAADCGIKAREIFLAHNDLYSAGKIENNIGNLFARRDMYREAEPYLELAHTRFTQIDDQRQLAMVENCQAYVKMFQNEFRDAETIYRRALERSSINKLTMTEAEIEASLSNLYLFEGKYDLALKFMEGSRLKYEELEMPNQSATCELEIADIYLELNLLPEAVGFYQKVEAQFAELGMQGELARCSLSYARALLRLGKPVEAIPLLDRAEELYKNEPNHVAAGSVCLARSQMLFDAGELADAEKQVGSALSAFEHGENPRFEMFARWLRAEIWRVGDRFEQAKSELTATLKRAKDQSGEIEYLCHVSLGRITGDETHFIAAAEYVENSRSTLVSEDLRTSYFSDKVEPFNEMVKMKFAQERFEEAFHWHERSRSKTLADRLNQTSDVSSSNEKLDEIREELNWYHSRLNRAALGGVEAREQIEPLRRLALERERDYAELQRRLKTGTTVGAADALDLDIDEFRSRLDDTTLVEFVSIDGRISAFVISKDNFTALPHYVDEADLSREITRFLFQLKTGRFVERLEESNRLTALERLQTYSRRIYDLLIRPLGDLADSKRLVFAPASVLHYMPFHALHDGNSFLIEKFEIAYAPSSAVIDRCIKRPQAGRRKILLAGVADALTPLIELEIEAIAPLFAEPVRLLGPDVTNKNLRSNIAGNDIIHLACHGKFRPDNPGFSSLSLYSEELTANEVHKLPLENCIIVMSSCESGLNEIVRGEELIGLTHSFFAAGASSLVMSLWRVNDKTTLELMKTFYSQFCSGKGLAESLRTVQLQLIDEKFHPYFWAPFIVSGRW